MSTTRASFDGWPDFPVVIPSGPLSEDEFEAWAFSQENIRAEWVDGAVVIAPPFDQVEDGLFHWLLHLLGNFVEETDAGWLFGPQFFLRFALQRRWRLPDLMFVARDREHLIKKTYLEGAPDLIFEIVSEDSRNRDWREKYVEYEKAGVREYWIVDPLSSQVRAFHLAGDGRYAPIEERSGAIASKVLPGYKLRAEWLWETPRPKVPQALRAMTSIV